MRAQLAHRGASGPARCPRLAVRAAAGPGGAPESGLTRRQLLNSSGALLASGLLLPDRSAAAPQSIYDFSALQYGEEVPLSKYKGQVLVIVNVASEWPLQNVNYPGLRTLYDKYHTDGFNLLAFPCNQFGGQAPGTSQEEREWAFRKFGFEFDVFDKIDVNGPTAHPLYQFLRQQQPVSAPGTPLPVPGGGPGAIEWNYTKFLVDREGQAVKRYKPTLDPLVFEGDVRLVLAGKPPLAAECIMHPGRKGCSVDRLLASA